MTQDEPHALLRAHPTDVPAADLRHGEVGQIDRFRIRVSKQVLAYTPPKPTTLRWVAGVWTTK